MIKVSMRHEIECSTDDFWKSYFDATLAKRLFLEGLGFRDWAVVKNVETETRIERTVSVEPVLAMPGPLVKLLGSAFRYSEEGVFDKASQVFTYKLVPSAMSEKILVNGTMKAEAQGPDKTLRMVDITVEANVMMVGKLIEETFAKQLEDGWTKGKNVQNEWLRAEKASAAK